MEFPSDNPELWHLRAPLTALALLVAETIVEDEPEVVPDSEVVPELEVIPTLDVVAEPELEVVTTVAAPTDHVARQPEPESEPEADPDVEVMEFDESDFAVVENESIPPPPPPDVFRTYVQTLVEVALASGAPGRVVEILPGMVGLARLDAQALDDSAIDSLVTAGLLARTESGAVTRSDAFVATAQAWRAMLLGEEADFSACTTMLDEWSATLIATLSQMPSQKESMRQQLRARGVAAFGLLVDAA